MGIQIIQGPRDILTLGAMDSLKIHSGKGQDAANGLLNNLIAYWPGDEAAGNLIDAHTNGLDLTDVNTVTNNAGLVYGTARQYTAATLEFHRRLGDDPLLSTGDVDFTLAVWPFMDSKPAQAAIVSKWTSGITQREYVVGYIGGVTDRFYFSIRNMGDTGSTLVWANTVGAPSVNTWYHILAQYDSVADLASIRVNNGPADSAAHAGGVRDTATPFRIGADNAGANYYDGRISPTMFWKSAAGGGGVLTAAQKTALWNGGAGLPYASFTS